MKRSLEMPVADGHTEDVQTYGRDQIYRTPISSAGGPKIVLDTAKPYVGNGYVGQRVYSTSSKSTTLCSRAKFYLLTPVPCPNEFLVN